MRRLLPLLYIDGAEIYCARFVRCLQERDAFITVSIGISRTGPVEFHEPDILLQVVDSKMYEKKAQHHGGLQRSDPATAA